MTPAEQMIERKKSEAQAKRQEIQDAASKTLVDLRFNEAEQARARVLLANAFASNPDLMNCTQASLLQAVSNAVTTGLEINSPAGEAYILPYKTTAQFIIGYQGKLKLLRRACPEAVVAAELVHKNDTFSHVVTNGTHSIRHVPDAFSADRGAIIGGYAIVQITENERYTAVMSWAEIEAIRKRSPASTTGPWATDWQAMAKKTIITQALKYAPKKYAPEPTTEIGGDDTTGDSKFFIDARLEPDTPELGPDDGGGVLSDDSELPNSGASRPDSTNERADDVA